MQEKRPIPGFDGYFADIYGNIWSNKFNKWRKLKDAKTKRGYHMVCLYIKKEGKTMHISKKLAPLVAAAFFGLKPKNREVCHINGNKDDNKPINLKYDTARANIKDRIKHNKRLQKNKLQIPLFAIE